MIKKSWIPVGNGDGYWLITNSYGDEISCDDNAEEIREAILDLEKLEEKYEKDS